MGYFRELPNVEYQDFLSDSISSQSYLTVKNLFRRNKLRDDLQNVFTVFDKYEIVEGARPDTVAEEYYGDSDLDWVVLITAGIINVRDEWPLSNQELYIFTENKYTILPAGKHVNNNFTIPKPDTSNEETATLNPVIGISNWEYEVLKNNEKRSIYLLRKIYLQQFLNDMRDIMIYQQSSQRINDRLIKTENTKVSIPR